MQQEEIIDENPLLKSTVEPAKETPLKNMIVDYVGNVVNPQDGGVTVEMIVEVMASEFPEFVLVLAEENWIRGYQQALNDVEIQVQQEAKETFNE